MTEQPETPEGKKQNKFAAWWGRQKTWAKIAMIAGVVIVLAIGFAAGRSDSKPEAQNTPAAPAETATATPTPTTESPTPTATKEPAPQTTGGVTEIDALQACNAYAKRQINQFKGRYIMGAAPSTLSTETDSWHVAFNGTGVNAYGAKIDVIVKCDVTGSYKSPTVISFEFEAGSL